MGVYRVSTCIHNVFITAKLGKPFLNKLENKIYKLKTLETSGLRRLGTSKFFPCLKPYIQLTHSFFHFNLALSEKLDHITIILHLSKKRTDSLKSFKSPQKDIKNSTYSKFLSTLASQQFNSYSVWPPLKGHTHSNKPEVKSIMKICVTF